MLSEAQNYPQHLITIFLFQPLSRNILRIMFTFETPGKMKDATKK